MRAAISPALVAPCNFGLLLGVLLLIAGCGGTASPHPSSTGTSASITLKGTLRGGQYPITGSTVQLYAAGATGYGSGELALLSPPVMTDQNGNFNFASPTCPSPSVETYLVATDGDPGLGVNNPAISLMTALGPCDSVESIPFIVINEVTTIASVWPLAPFMNYGADVGSSPANEQELAIAFTNVNSLADITRGSSPGTSVPAGVTIPVDEINTLADILASCINSEGTTACNALFALAVLPGGPVPTNTLDAVLNIALNPGANVAALFALSTPQAPFLPSLSTQPSAWTFGNAITTNLPAPAYYVDSVNGNDANSGLSPAQAVNTIAQLTALDATNPLNTWNLASNSHWREQLTTPRSNMTVQSYGTGSLPMLDASDIIPNANWTKTQGYVNIYQVTVPIAETTEWMNLWRNGSYVTSIQYSLATLDAASSPSWTTVDTASGSEQNTLSSTGTETIYMNVQTDPAADGALYEYAHREYGLYLTYGGTVSNLATRANLARNGSMSIAEQGGNASVYNVDVSDGSKHNLIVFHNFAGQQIQVNGCTTENSYFGTNNSLGRIQIVYTGQGFAGSGQSLLVESCNLTTGADGFTGNDGLSGHYSGSGYIDSMTFENNTGSSGTQFGSLAANVTWNGNYGPIELENFLAGSTQQITASNITSPTTIVSDYGAGSTWNIHDNPLLEGGPGLGMNVWGAVSILNSTVMTPASDSIYSNGAVALTLHGDTFSNTSSQAFIYAIAAGSTITSDYNTWCNPNTSGMTQFDLPSGNYYYAGYQAATGQDTHSILCGIQSVSPSSGNQNSTVSVTITGAGTHFAGSSIVTVSGTGVTVGSISSVTSTSLTVPLIISSGAAVTPRSITVTTGSEVYTLNAGFTVNSL